MITVRPNSGAKLPDLPVGARLRILPNHACPTASQFAAYAVPFTTRTGYFKAEEFWRGKRNPSPESR